MKIGKGIAIYLAAIIAITITFVCTNEPSSAQVHSDHSIQQREINERFQLLTRNSHWELVSAEILGFSTYHPQGMTKAGDHFFLSSVEIIDPTEPITEPDTEFDRTAGTGVGYIFKFDSGGQLLDSIVIGHGDRYHPGGIDYDGELYTWHLDQEHSPNVEEPPEDHYVYNRQHYIDYQDCQYIGNDEMICGGLSNYYFSENKVRFPLGGLDLIDLNNVTLLYQLPVELFTAGENPRVMTQNPVFIEPIETGLRVYFIPEDDESHFFIYEIKIP